jgi:gas vesicle protein
MSDNSNDLGAFLAGFVIGGLVGAATAIILAPQSGAETRSQLASRSNELVNASGEQLQDIRSRASSTTQNIVQKANEQFATPLHQLDEARGRMQEQARIVLDKGRDRVAQARANAPDSDNVEEATPMDSNES